MPRITDIKQLLFPVEEHPVFAHVETEEGEKRILAPGHKAILNAKSGRVVGIVSQGYRLVSNREALDAALECCHAAFPETKPAEWKVEATDAPSTGAWCQIDLFHNSATLDFRCVPAAERPDVFGPFIRVTNSYNTFRALAFDVGFYRKVCSNGLILPDAIISLKFTHLSRDIGERIEFKIDHPKLVAAKRTFSEYLDTLRNCEVMRGQFSPLLHAVLRLHPPSPLEPRARQTQEWHRLTAHLHALADRYAGELGENAYAVFNTVTDFASHPPPNRCVHRDRHSLQLLAGSWLAAFSQECRKPGFQVSSYLEQLAKPKANQQN